MFYLLILKFKPSLDKKLIFITNISNTLIRNKEISKSIIEILLL